MNTTSQSLLDHVRDASIEATPRALTRMELLEQACLENNVHKMAQWLALGNDVNHPLITKRQRSSAIFPHDDSLLRHAIGDGSEGRIEMVKMVLDAGAKVDLHVRCDGATSLMRCIVSSKRAIGDVRMAKMILDAGADVNAKADNGLAAVHNAAFRGDVQMLALLVDHGANLEAITSQNETVLHCTNRCADTCQWLVSRVPGLINAQNSNGITALSSCITLNRLDAVQILMAGGADPHVRTNSGQDAFDLSRCYGHDEITTWMENFEAAKAARATIEDVLRKASQPGGPS